MAQLGFRPRVPSTLQIPMNNAGLQELSELRRFEVDLVVADGLEESLKF